MHVKFLGAAGTVTGSRTLLSYGRGHFLVDCGLFQGTRDLRQMNWDPFPFPASRIDAVFLTHAHLDHSGYLPRLVKEGFAGPIYASSGTLDLCEILLRDSARLQEEDAEYANQTGHSRHKPALPLYDLEDVERCLKHFRPIPRGQWKTLDAGLGLRLGRAGHITGASFAEFSVSAGQSTKVLAFSGDVGHSRSPILRAPEPLQECDVLVLESTYGNRLHDRGDVGEAIARRVRPVLERGGVLLIPSFAVGRTQEILFHWAELERRGLLPSVPVILDSPMADAATEVFFRHPEDHLLDKSFGPRSQDLFPRHFENSRTVDDSMLAAMRDGPLVVIAGAGMVTGGRILHHLKRRLPDPKNAVLFVGYQAEGSKGRFLLEEGKSVGAIRIHHREVPVEAEVFQVSGLSAHGDYEDLLGWVGQARRKPSKIFLNHGSPEAVAHFAERIRERFGIPTEAARAGQGFDV